MPCPMKLCDWLDKSGMRQEDFAERVGTGQPQVSRWVRGEARPSGRFLAAIAAVTGGAVTLSDFYPSSSASSAGA